MRKICPYCGRIGELGTPCPGCAHVLLMTDATAPEDTLDEATETERLNTVPLTSLDDVADMLRSAYEHNMPAVKQPESVIGVILASLMAAYGAYGLSSSMQYFRVVYFLDGNACNEFPLAMFCGGLLGLLIYFRKSLKYLLLIVVCLVFITFIAVASEMLF